MDSPTPINFQAHAGRVAQTYGVRKPAGAAFPAPARESGKATIGADGLIRPPFSPAANPNGNSAESRQDRVTFSGGNAIPEQIEQLIAGQVDSPVSRGQGFDEPPPQRGSAAAARGGAPGAYAMYTRSADRVEVATSVAIGRSLDARG
ncbi:MAG: hypothetical protein RLY21_899 [Planctomycetota bacterium]|jgi:hypothetical protein